ncbi:translation initiation factor IF-2 [Candidatus Poribacteria bacterium]|nr:translation initiation factor IF-2 [Candidatus Poribacteria bacterium]MYB66491.1 translation initiation factor IF-2 [Candidatus Poribacteria bacterium]MYF55487.1 translation initiation factor IF-2 [Candidatus Poribacteria bacterium]
MKKKKQQTKTTPSQNVRVYELAKRHDMSSKELISFLNDLGVAISNHMSTLDPETIMLVESELNPEEDIIREQEKETTERTTQEQKRAQEQKSKDKIKTKDETISQEDFAPDDDDTTDDEDTADDGTLKIQEGTTVGELASLLGLQPTQLIMQLMKLKIMASINQSLDYQTLLVLGEQFDFNVVKEKTLEEELLLDEEDPPESLVPRSPVITIMGHVDHGKTSLLDSIRESNVSESEEGNITQHIGAYHVELENGNIVFLDTPGHAAFTAMRARGADVTDIVVLIIAADDGVMPQTIEAISHAKAAKVPIVVAINKMDVLGARPDYVKQQLVENELVPEDWGGQTICVEISAVEGTGIDLLLEMLLLEAALLELKANPHKLARGVVIEAQVDKERGPVATVLVQSGTLRVGDSFVSGRYSGRVRAMMSDDGKRIKEAGPSTPVVILGFTGVPEAGDIFYVLESEKDARAISEERQDQYRISKLGAHSHVSLDDLFQQIQEGEIKELNVIIKGDVQGSVQAISESLLKLSTTEVKINIIHEATGGITETDILLASASDAIVIGFNVHPTTEAVQATEAEGIDVRTYTVIYDILSDIRSAMEGLLEPEVKEVIIGRAEVREIFKAPRIGSVAGSYVNWGRITFNQPLRVLRDNRMIYEGKVDSLRRFKDNVNEVQANYECGIGIDEFDDIKVGDVLECFVHEHVARTLQ